MKKEHNTHKKSTNPKKTAREEFSYLREEGEEKFEEMLKKVKKKLDTTEQTAKEYLDGWQRERADFANYKKDIQKYISATSDRVREEVLLEGIVLVDNLELMMQHAHETIIKSDWFRGVENVHKQALQSLKRHGIEAIQVQKGDPFDPAIHEAVEGPSHDESMAGKEGQLVIAEVVQKGYKMGDRVVRPAKVRVIHQHQ